MTLDELNTLVNLHEVREGVAPGYMDIDLSDFAGSETGVIVGDSDGAVIFADTGGGDYEMHYLMSYACRGARAVKLAKKAIRTLFTTTNAQCIYGDTPEDMLAARLVNRTLGGTPIGPSVDYFGRRCIRYKLDRTTWAHLSAESLAVSAH